MNFEFNGYIVLALILLIVFILMLYNVFKDRIKVHLYTKEGRIATLKVKFQRFNVNGRVILSLGDMKVTIPKGERIVGLGLEHSMFNTMECIIDYKVDREQFSRRRDLDVVLKDNHVLVPNYFLKGYDIDD